MKKKKSLRTMYFRMAACFLLMVFGLVSYAQDADDEVMEADSLDAVTIISEEEAREIMNGLLNVQRLRHALQAKSTMKDDSLKSLTDKFTDSTGVDVISYPYIDGDSFWSKMLKQWAKSKYLREKGNSSTYISNEVIFSEPANVDAASYNVGVSLSSSGADNGNLDETLKLEKLSRELNNQYLEGAAFNRPKDARDKLYFLYQKAFNQLPGLIDLDGGRSGSGIEDLESDGEGNKDKGYYVILANDTTKYKYGDEMVLIRHKSKVKLTIGFEKDTLVASNLRWEIDGKEVCKGKQDCEVDLSKEGNYKIKIFNGTDNVLKINLDIYRKPVVKFDRGSGYNGEFGFDPAKQSELRKAKDYDTYKFKVEGTDYYTPWFTFRNGQTIMLEYKVDTLQNNAKNDKNFEITFKSSSTNLMIDGVQELKIDYNTASSKGNLLIVTASGGSSTFDSPAFITATDHKGDEIGKLAVVHGSIEPDHQFDVVFVKVKHHKKYPTFNESNAVFKLSEESHNQFFRSWTNVTTSSDTLDISNYYKANKRGFQTSTNARNKIIFLYNQEKNINIADLSGSRFYVFISDISISKSDSDGKIGKVAGIAGGIGKSRYCVLFYDRGSSTAAHELGHVLGFKHTFSDDLNQRKIPEKTTENYMDYSTTRNMFFLYQMKKIK